MDTGLHSYDGPERRDLSYHPPRKMVLTDADVAAIAVEVKKHHVCRYDIEPKDMASLLDFVRSFQEGAIETRRTFRTAAIRMIVWGAIAGFIALLEVKFRWIRPLLRFITGVPQ